MHRITSVILWIILNILPDSIALRLMDLILPDWEASARKAMKARRDDTE